VLFMFELGFVVYNYYYYYYVVYLYIYWIHH